MKWKINHGKQVHAMGGLFSAAPHGVEFFDIPKTAFLYDVLFHIENPLPPAFYRGSFVSLGAAGDKEYFSRKADISKGGVIRAELGKGAGYQQSDVPSRLFWHYSGQGEPSSGPMRVVVLFAFM